MGANVYVLALQFLLCWRISFTQEQKFMLATGSGQGAVYQIDLDTGKVLRNISTAVSTGVMYDGDEQVVYRAQYFSRNIVRFCLTKCNKDAVFSTGEGQPEHVAVDFSTGNVYFSAITPSETEKSSFIGVINPSRNKQRKIITGLNQPRAIALYPSKGIMFWSDYGDDFIERASMDGSGRNVIVRDTECVGLAIDYTADLLYHGAYFKGEIFISDFDGGNTRTIVRDSVIEDVLLNGPYLYYSRLNLKPAITKVSKESGKNVTFMDARTDIGRIQSIDIHPRDELPINDECADRNGLCSDLCLPSPGGSICTCQDGVSLSDDGLTCEGEIRCPTTIPGGMLDPACTSFPGEICTFSCDPGFYGLSTSNISCTSTGDWDPDISTLCIDMQNQTSSNSNSIIIAVIVVAIVFIIIIVIIFIVLIRRRRVRVKGKPSNDKNTAENIPYYTTLNDGYETPMEKRYDKLHETETKRYMDMGGENYYSVVY